MLRSGVWYCIGKGFLIKLSCFSHVLKEFLSYRVYDESFKSLLLFSIGETMNFKGTKTVLAAFGLSAVMFATHSFAQPAFKVMGKEYSVDDVSKRDQSSFYDIEKKKHQLIEQHAQTMFMEMYWENMGKKSGKTAEQAEEQYLKDNVKVADKEIEETLNRFKDHPQLSKLSKEEQKQQVSDYLYDSQKRNLLQDILANAMKNKEIEVVYPEPKEPIYNLVVTKEDHVKYGPNSSDIKPMGCEGDKCQITVVEYSEFQCPFCAKVLPDTKKLMEDYKGKIRWVVRDWPLSFHNRAEPAAIAAKCSAKQGKYWEMYTKLFENQRALEDADITNYAKQIKLNMANFEKCLQNPKEIKAQIDANVESGSKLGVTGTPAFFINGRRLSGAVPYGQFKKIMDEELSSKS